MKKRIILLLVLVVSGFSMSLAAEPLSYTYIAVAYGRFNSNIDKVSSPLVGDGYTIDLSYAVRQHVAIFAGYSISIADAKIGVDDFNADIDSSILGMTVHFPINDGTDLVVDIGFFNGKADISVNGESAGDVRANGGVVAIGFRSMVSESIELRASLRKNSIEENTSVSLDVGAAYYVVKSVSLNLGYRIDTKDGSDFITLGVIKYF